MCWFLPRTEIPGWQLSWQPDRRSGDRGDTWLKLAVTIHSALEASSRNDSDMEAEAVDQWNQWPFMADGTMALWHFSEIVE